MADAPLRAIPARPSVPHLRALHSSDLHIGTVELRPHTERLRDLARVAEDVGADVMLVPGDVFDHAQMAETIVAAAGETLRRESDLPVVILPGNHDCLVNGSYLGGCLDALPGVYIVGNGGGAEYAWVPELDAVFWGRPHRDYEPLRPFDAIPAAFPVEAPYRIGLGHGHLAQRAEDERDLYRFYLAELEGHPFGYVALGHWDRYYAVSPALRTYYSGAAHHAGSVNVVDVFADGRADVYRLAVDIA